MTNAADRELAERQSVAPPRSAARGAGDRKLDVAMLASFVLLALVFVVPALPGTGRILGGEDLAYFRPPISELRPADLTRPANALLQDPVEVFHPDLLWTVEQVRAGHVPLWNPYVGAGWPQLASQQTAPLFPLNVLAYVIPFWSSLGLIAALRILLAAGGTYLFCRSCLRLGAAPAALSAVAFASGGYFIAWLEHPHGNVYALLPWLLLTVDRAIRRPTATTAGAFGAVLGLAFLGGNPQSVLIDGFLVAPYALWRLAGWGRDGLGPAGPVGRSLAVLGVGVLLGLAAGAVMLIPLLDFIHASAIQQRGGVGGLPRSGLASLAFPELWGRPDAGFDGVGPINYFERTIYVGAPAILLAVVGLAVRRGGAQWFFAAMAVVGAVLAVSLPLVTWFVDHVPPFSLVAIVRTLVISSFCMAVLGGYGLQRLLDADDAGRRRALIAAAAAAIVPLLWILVTRAGAADDIRDGLGAVPGVPGEPATGHGAVTGAALRWIVLSAIVLALLVALRRRPAAKAALVAALLAVQVVDLVELGRGLHPIIDDRVVHAAAPPVLARARAEQGFDRTAGDGFYLLPNQGERFGLRDLRARGEPTIKRVDALYAAYTGGSPRMFLVDWPGAGPLLDAFAVTHVLTGTRAADPANRNLQVEASTTDDILFRNTGALPRAYVVSSWRRAEGADQAIAMTASSSATELRRSPPVETRAAPPPIDGSSSGIARFDRDEPDRVELTVTSDRPARLVLLDAYYPGWQAKVNGRRAQIAATSGAFRSVPVPPGRSKVEFRYRPTSVYVGAAISAIAWTVLLGLGAPALVRRRRHAATSRGDTFERPSLEADR